MNTVIRHVTPADLERCYAIETVAYEGDEAATREKSPPASPPGQRALSWLKSMAL